MTVLTNDDGDFNNMTLEKFTSMKRAYTILENFSVDYMLSTESCEVLKISPNGKRHTVNLRGSSFDSLRLKKEAIKGDVYIFTNNRVEFYKQTEL
ncbi:hypothetical protein [Kordia sp.]|uniref:hypothetical protein n=1 Tax=Kordia sp. TaxID=1965332 RepID=UPI0025BC474B|nr:hypothetical protein [Kordia sp.]MCH2193228.1 hypothetical protein [Kordia sp.]